MLDYYKNTLKYEESKIPVVWRRLMAEVIRQKTGLDVRKMLAGEHQARQHDAHAATTADNVAAFMRHCKEKRAKLQTPVLSDNDVWLVVKGIGLDRESSFDEMKKKKPNENETILRQRIVCHPIINNEAVRVCLSLRKTITLRRGGRSRSSALQTSTLQACLRRSGPSIHQKKKCSGRRASERKGSS